MTLAVLAALALMLLVAGALALRNWRWGGIDLATLLDRHPDAGPDVQRVLSAIRHEVLKHNTLMLDGLIERIRSGAESREPVEHILRAFFGADGHGGAEPRLHAYAEQLVSIGRAHGERLNLAQRDPLTSALLSGFARMRQLRHALLAVDDASPAAHQRLADELRAVDQLLNERGHAALRALLDRVRLLHVDAALLNAVFDRVRHEPALATASIAPLALDPRSELPCALALPRPAFDDILSNLFRNALEASIVHGAPAPIVVGVLVVIELDPVTAIERVALHVRDRAPHMLERAQLRDAYIEAGLGLTADLVAQRDGQLDLSEQEPGFEKAVVLRLPGQRSERT